MAGAHCVFAIGTAFAADAARAAATRTAIAVDALTPRLWLVYPEPCSSGASRVRVLHTTQAWLRARYVAIFEVEPRLL